tara:strand:+ start:202 stop:798 length:597 start_codon:yes stop_codon:yes gene_type:complete
MSWTKHNLLPFDGEVYLLENAFDAKELEPLYAELAWRQDDITLWGKTYPVPRLQAWYADDGLSYTYSKIRMEANEWTDNLKKIKNKVNRISNIKFNSVLCNYYRDGSDKNGWHRDNEKELGREPPIASVSYGSARKFSLRHLKTKEKIDLILPSESLLLMTGLTQHEWEHQLSPTKKLIGPRLNLTFRCRKSDDKLEL